MRDGTKLGLQWLIGFGLIISSIFCMVYAQLIQCRRRKNAEKTDARVIKETYTMGTHEVDHFTGEDMDTTVVSYEFRISRPDIAWRSLYTIVNRFCYHQLPPVIIDTILEYIGDSIKFWYGPYRNSVTFHTNNKIYIGPTIGIVYDSTNPQHSTTPSTLLLEYRCCCLEYFIRFYLFRSIECNDLWSL